MGLCIGDLLNAVTVACFVKFHTDPMQQPSHMGFSLSAEEMITRLIIYPNGYRVTLGNGITKVLTC